MKQGTKTALSVAGIILALGVAMHLTGLAMGGRNESDLSFRSEFFLGPSGIHIGGKNGIHITSDGVDIGGEHGIHVGSDSINVGGLGQGNGQAAEKVQVIEKEELDSFTSIDVDLELGDIWLQEGEGPTVSVSWNLKNYAINSWVEDGVLKIADQSEKQKSNEGLSLSSKVIITLPAGTELDRIDFYTDLGDIYVDAGIAAQSAFLETDLGDISCMALKAAWLEARTDLGDVDITFPQREEVNYTLASELGETWVDGKERGESCSGGVAAGQYIINGVSSLGNVSLRFE